MAWPIRTVRFKRAYALGQFAKHIRPGNHRVDATASPATNLNVSAYTGDNKVVIVAVNTGNASVNQNFVLRGGTASELSSWQTTTNSNMAAGQSYQASNGAFTASLPSQSITTFVGNLSGTVGSGGNTSTGGASAIGGSAGRSGSGGIAGVGGAIAGAGGRGAAGGMSSVGGAIVTGTGGRSGAGGMSSVGGAIVTGTGGRSGAGGMSSVGGATVTEVGGGVSSGGQGGATGSGGASGGSGGTTALGAGGTATGGRSAIGPQGETGGSVNGGSITPTDESSGCSCALAGRDARRLGGGFGALLALLGLALTRRRASAR
jgi:hypothetical protein